MALIHFETIQLGDVTFAFDRYMESVFDQYGGNRGLKPGQSQLHESIGIDGVHNSGKKTVKASIKIHFDDDSESETILSETLKPDQSFGVVPYVDDSDNSLNYTIEENTSCIEFVVKVDGQTYTMKISPKVLE